MRAMAKNFFSSNTDVILCDSKVNDERRSELTAEGGLVGEDLSVAYMNDAMRKLRDICFVSDKHDGISAGVKLIEKRHDFEARLGVQVARRLVCKDDRRVIDKGASERNALALTPRELTRLVHHARFEPDIDEGLLRARDAFRGGCAVVNQGQFHVVQRASSSQQVEGLEDETNFLVANPGQLIVVKVAYELTVEPIAGLSRGCQGSQSNSSTWICPSRMVP